MVKGAKETNDFAQIIRAKLAKNPALADAVDAARIAADIAEEIYQARTESGLTQKQLAARIGTQQSVIARMEDADYQGHSVSMLRKIAAATGKRLGIGFYAKSLARIAGAEERYRPAWTAQEWRPEIEDQGISSDASVKG